MASAPSARSTMGVWDFWGNVTDPSPRTETLLKAENLRIPTKKEADREVPVPDSDILREYEELLEARTNVHFGYPYNLNLESEDLSRFLKYSINNLGDPFITSNYGVHSRQFELSVLDFFARLWQIPKDEYWGYVTTCGTEGNLHGLLVAREVLPDAILYASRESHYSIVKASRFFRIPMRNIPSLYTGEIDYDALATELERNRDKPAIINVNIGTTVKGAVDDLDRILRILHSLDIPRERYFIHCDGALFALMLPWVKYGPEVSFRKPIDAIAVSGHKFLGAPMPCGVIILRKKHMDKVTSHIEYLNSVDTTIVGSRNGQAPLFMWYTLRRKGVEGMEADVRHCFDMAAYLRDRLRALSISVMLNDLSSTVVLQRPPDHAFVRRWQLACTGDIAHVVVMPNVTRDKIDQFLVELVDVRSRFTKEENSVCVRRHIGRFCICDACVARGKSIAIRLDDGTLSTVKQGLQAVQARDAPAAAEAAGAAGAGAGASAGESVVEATVAGTA